MIKARIYLAMFKTFRYLFRFNIGPQESMKLLRSGILALLLWKYKTPVVVVSDDEFLLKSLFVSILVLALLLT